ncbi:MAG TPA: hypothetical protein VFY25_01665 [Anaerolineales bacterium]|nr:hypothetical protein [Anaerolineales bacterium]
MAEINDRLQRAIEELSGNEALLEMLDTEAALAMLNWGIATARSIVARTSELDDFTADLALLPRLKAIRQSMRSIGNWAAGKYVDPASRIQLRDKLLGYFSTIFSDERPLPSPENVDQVLSQVDDATNTPRQLVQNLTQLIEEPPQA